MAGAEHPSKTHGSKEAWTTWLEALAIDANAALAASLAYEALDSEGRLSWLDALDEDSAAVSGPLVAIYAPLLAVERDHSRRVRIERAMAQSPFAYQNEPVRAFVSANQETRVCLLIMPLYLSFASVLVCRYAVDHGIVSAHREPLCHINDVTRFVGNDKVMPAPVSDVIDELSHAVLADRRAGREAPPALTAVAHLFGLNHAEWRHAGDASP